MNHSILSNEDLATMCAEALESAEARGLWGIKVDQYGMFDAAWDISRDSTNCNAIINDSDRVASTHVADAEPSDPWFEKHRAQLEAEADHAALAEPEEEPLRVSGELPEGFSAHKHI